MIDSPATPNHAAPQHGPRPLPLFLHMLRSETAASDVRRAAALAGLKAYQEAPRPEKKRFLPVICTAGRARLLDYGGGGRPVIFVPSLINPPSILDLDEGTSLLRWIAGRGVHAHLVDWGEATPDDRGMSVAGHVEQLLMPLIASMPEPPVLVGYCLGGTMAMAAAVATRVAGLATIAAPWRFAGYGESRPRIAELWARAKPACAAMGLVPVEVLQTGFWQLDPARTIAKYEAFADLPPDSAAARAFVRLEDWANDGAPLTYAAGCELFEEFLGGDSPGTGTWQVGGVPVMPGALDCPAVEFVSLTDRIVPAATAAGLPDRRDIGAGHVGMIVGSRGRAQLWEPLVDWITALPAPR